MVKFVKSISTLSDIRTSQMVLVVKNLLANAGDTRDTGSIRRAPGRGNSNSLQYSCLKNSVDRETGYSPWGCRESDTAVELSTGTTLYFFSVYTTEGYSPPKV